MTSAPPAQPVYLSTQPDAVLGFLHPASPERGRETAVLLLPPFGWEEVASYRSRMQIADELASAGHPVLRIDLPGSGDSAGSPRDAARLDAWVGAAGQAAAWLRAETGSARVAAFGMSLGGLVGYLAAAGDAPIDDLVLWGVPARGRTLVRELRAFARLNTGDEPDPRPESRPALPEGLLQVSGYVIAPETGAALGAVDLCSAPLPRAESRRVLILERDGVGVDPELRASLEDSGAEVTVAPGDGFGLMTTHPQESKPPPGLSARIANWLGAATDPALATGSAAVRRLDRLELTVDGREVTEIVVAPRQPSGRLLGVLAQPAHQSGPAELGILLLNSGSIRRTGPNRMWVETARKWAARGVPTLRLDVEGIGDADGPWTRYADTPELYKNALEDQVMTAVDDLENRGVARRFVVVGLCSGAYWAFHALRRHDRISAAFLVNLFFFYWTAERSELHKVPRPRRLLSPRVWLRLIRGQGDAARMRAFLRWAIRSPAQGWRRLTRRHTELERIDAALDRLRDQDKRAVLFLGAGEPLWEYLERDGLLPRMDEWPNVELHQLAPADHTFRALWMQHDVHEALDAAIEKELRRTPLQGPAGAEPGMRFGMAASGEQRA